MPSASRDHQYADTKRHELVAFVPAEATTVLDVGCNYGAFGLTLKQARACEVWGIEPDPAAARVAEERLDHVVNDFFGPANPLPERYFDLITFNDSLEHMVDPTAALETCKHLLKPGGHVHCCVPNIRNIKNLEHLILDKDWHYEDEGIRDRTHLRFFTEKSIVDLFRSCGFEVLDARGINEGWWDKEKILRRLAFRLLPEFTRDMRHVQILVRARLN